MKLLSSLPQTPLTREEESALSVKARRRDEDAANKLVLHNMEEGFTYAKGVDKQRIKDDGEIFSLTYKALLGSAYRFNPKYGLRFLAFAKVNIRGALKRYWASQDTVKNASLHYTGERGPSYFEIRQAAFEKLNENPDDRHGPLDPDSMLGFDIDDAVSENTIDQRVEFNEAMARVMPIIEGKLCAQEQMVLDLVYIAGFTFQEVGELLDISRSAVQLCRTRAIKKIRVELARSEQRLL